MQETRYTVPGIHCGHCGEAISAEVAKVEGVVDVDVDVAGKVVTVRGAVVDDALVRRAIADAGYEATGSASAA